MLWEETSKPFSVLDIPETLCGGRMTLAMPTAEGSVREVS